MEINCFVKTQHIQDDYFVSQLLCLEILDELSRNRFCGESVTKLLNFIECKLDESAVQGKEHEFYRVIFGTAFKIFYESVKGATCNNLVLDSALQIINTTFKKLNIKDCRNLSSFFRSISCRCIILADSQINNVVTVGRIVTYLAHYVDYMFEEEMNRKDLFAKQYSSELALLISFFISEFCLKTTDLSLRIMAGNALLKLTKPCHESSCTVRLFLPGICSRMNNIACLELNTKIIITALKVLESTVITCFGNSWIRDRNEAQALYSASKKGKFARNISRDDTSSIDNIDMNLKNLLTLV
ncbi:unnamed protein product [Thelazia callipaeda]|uniref:DUF4042 domain-containing protein n=1 Tax=Thelazia callipaeda TaxID=103827 RepID=A0A0N5CQ72_THECL|nr:unnamed protein product [Thelazia callipaeda]